MSLFGDRLRELRKGRDMSLKDLGDLLGITGAAVSAWELGKQQPGSDETLAKLAAMFGVSVDYLLGRTDDRSPVPPPAFDEAALATRWPDLSPDRRRKAADMERDAKAQGIELKLAQGMRNEEFDALLRDTVTFAAFIARQRSTPGE